MCSDMAITAIFPSNHKIPSLCRPYFVIKFITVSNDNKYNIVQLRI